GLDPIFEVGQSSSGAGLKQYVYKTILRPNDQCSAMVGTLETRAFVTTGFRQPLLVGCLTIQRTGGQDFTVLNRQRPEFHGAVIRVHLLIDVSPTIDNFNHLKFLVTGRNVLGHIVLVVMPSASASAPIIRIEIRLRRAHGTSSKEARSRCGGGRGSQGLYDRAEPKIGRASCREREWSPAGADAL